MAGWRTTMRRWIEGTLAVLLLASLPAVAKDPPVAPFRAEYVAAFYNVINWEFASDRYRKFTA